MIIDRQILIDLYGNASVAKPLIQMFIKNSKDLVQEIEQAIFLERQDQIDSVCHRLLGQSRYIGSPLIGAISEDIRHGSSKVKLEKLNELKSIIQTLLHDEKFQ